MIDLVNILWLVLFLIVNVPIETPRSCTDIGIEVVYCCWPENPNNELKDAKAPSRAEDKGRARWYFLGCSPWGPFFQTELQWALLKI